MKNEIEIKAMSLKVAEDLTVSLIPNSNHEFLMTTKEVSKGYGVSESVLRTHSSVNSNEFIEGKHYLKCVQIPDALPKGTLPHANMWTKRGVVRLGFFIKSFRAKLFRDWAEDLILEKIENPVPVQVDIIGSAEKVMKVILNLKDQQERMQVYEAFQELKSEIDIYKQTNKGYLLAEKSRILKKLAKNRTYEENRILSQASKLAKSLEV